jgi:hypothetical protein
VLTRGAQRDGGVEAVVAARVGGRAEGRFAARVDARIDGRVAARVDGRVAARAEPEALAPRPTVTIVVCATFAADSLT